MVNKKKTNSEKFSEAANIVMDKSANDERGRENIVKKVSEYPSLLAASTAVQMAKEQPTLVFPVAAGTAAALTGKMAVDRAADAVSSLADGASQWGERQVQEKANIEGSKVTLYDDNGELVTYDLSSDNSLTKPQILDFSLTKNILLI